MEKLFFSVILTSYNYENYIKYAIESVISQKYLNWELIIVDDGSSDNSVDIIKSYCKVNSNIKLFCHDKNKGLIETLKSGINKANYDWIVFLESDDTICDDYLEKKADIIANNQNIGFIFNDVNLIGDEKRIDELKKHFKITNEILSKNPYPSNLFKYFKKINLIPAFSVVALKKNLLYDIDYNSPIDANIDYYLWVQIAKKTDIFYLDEKLTNWRLHEKSYIVNNKTTVENNEFFNFKKNLFFLPFYQKPFIPFMYLWCLIVTVRKKIIRFDIKNKRFCILGYWHKLWLF